MAIPTSEKKGASGGVQSLHRAKAILQTVAAEPNGISLAELSKRVKLHNSTTFHLAKTLTAIGFLRQDTNNRNYRIGPELFGLASSALTEVELVDVSATYLLGLAKATRATAHVAVFSHGSAVIIAKQDGSNVIQLIERIGIPRPAYATSIGKVLLAARDEEEIEDYIATCNFQNFSPTTIDNPAQLRVELEKVRSSGIAFDNGEFNPELRCIAAPVMDFQNNIIAAIGVSFPIWQIAIDQIDHIVVEVRQYAGKVSKALGASI